MMEIIRTEKQIQSKIEKLSSDSNKFTDEDYCWDGEDETREEFFSRDRTKETLMKLINWLTDEKSKV